MPPRTDGSPLTVTNRIVLCIEANNALASTTIMNPASGGGIVAARARRLEHIRFRRNILH